MSISEICLAIENTWLSTAVRESIWVFPILLGVHSLGLGLSVGTLFWFDLRLLGLSMTAHRVSEVYRSIAPWMLTGFAVMFVSGGLLLWAQAGACYDDGFCRAKLLVLPLAGLNAAAYHSFTERGIGAWDSQPRPPLSARVAGGCSIALWLVIIALGRQIFT